MKRRHSALVPFLSGVFATLMLMSMVLSAGATETVYKNITVRPGIKMYIDDVQLIPRDVTGAEVDVFIYYGTTYVPARALSEALGRTIQYDGKTSSVYIGKHAADSPAVMLADMDYFAGTKDVKTQASDQDSVGNTHYSCIIGSSTDYGWSRKYVLDGQYSRMTGTLYQQYAYRSKTIRKNTSFEVYGDGKLLYGKTFAENTEGYYPESFEIDLTGVLQLEVVVDKNWREGFAVGDCGLWT